MVSDTDRLSESKTDLDLVTDTAGSVIGTESESERTSVLGVVIASDNDSESDTDTDVD